MVVDYADYFWGDKHLGFHVLYQNLKSGVDGVQELSHFLKDRISIEEEHAKLMTKNLNRVTSFVQSGNFASGWQLTKATMELIEEVHATFIRNLHDLSKEAAKYGDEMSKCRRRIKEKDTFEAVNLMQTTTTCLQKSKETYISRCIEMEKLKRENIATPKEIAKVEAKMTRAREEYRQYVDKYSRVRDDFEDKMIKSARSFQSEDRTHMLTMKKMLADYAKHVDECNAAVSQVSSQFRETVDQLNVDDMLLKFAQEKSTGRDRPESAIFEEPDLNELLPPPTTTTTLLASSTSTRTSTDQPSLPMIMSTKREPNNDLIVLDSVNEWSTMPTTTTNNQQISPTASDSSSSTATASANQPTSTASIAHLSSSSSRQKLSLWLPMRSSRKKNSSQSSLPPTIATTGGGDSTTNNSNTLVANHTFSQSHNDGGFLKKRYRKSKKKSMNDLSVTTSTLDDHHPMSIAAARSEFLDDTRSTASSNKSDERTNNMMSYAPKSATAPIAIVDDEGFNIRPDDMAVMPSSSMNKNRWSSCTDSSDEESSHIIQASKIRHLSIKPFEPSSRLPTASAHLDAASTDELRDAVSQISIGAARSMSRSRTFENDPWTATSIGAGAGNRHIRPLRPAYTGDEHLHHRQLFNESEFGLSNVPLNFSASLNAGSIPRARPRSNTPTLFAHSSGASFFSQNDNITSFNRSESIGSLSTTSSGGRSTELSSSNTTTTISNSTEQRIPIAMAIHEYAHAWFIGTDINRAKIRTFGTVMISFPANVLHTIIDTKDDDEPLQFSLIRADKIQSIVPNKEILSLNTSNSQSNDTFQFTFNRIPLINLLKKEKETKPNSPFYNFDVLRYEVSNPVTPLFINSFWKCENANTDIRIDYRLNIDCPIECALLNLTFSTKINGKVEKVIAMPEAEWDASSDTLTWRLTELSKHGDSSGSLKARLSLHNGPSTPASTIANFQTSDASISGALLQIDSDRYVLSMTRRKVLAGKFFCDAESR